MMAFSTLFAGPEETLSSATAFMQAAMKKRQELNQEKLVNAASGLLDVVSLQRNAHVTNLKNIRKQESLAKDQLKRFERAALYFESTGNFGPLSMFLDRYVVANLCAQLGVNIPDEDDKKIPDGWEPPTTS